MQQQRRAARATWIAGLAVAIGACGDGDKLPLSKDDGGLQSIYDGGGDDLDASVANDGATEMDGQTQRDGASLADASGDGEIPLDPDAGCPVWQAPAGGVCTNIDECTTGVAQCAPGETCTDINGPGRYRCGECLAGTVAGPNGDCVNVDECMNGTSGCLPMAVCTDVTPTESDPITHACSCPSGFTGNGVSSCTDVDECVTNANNCPMIASVTTCVNTPGSFECRCPSGSELTNAGGTLACIDVDECFVGTHTCDPHVTCTNTDPGYTCGACPAGYATPMGGDTKTELCQDVDECVNNPCGGAGPCLNTAGSHTCLNGAACPPGTLETAGVCVNVNECANDTDLCASLILGATDAACYDTTQPYKYVCSCPLGTAGLPLQSTVSMDFGCFALEADSPQLAAGYLHTCAVAPDQSIRCWGSADGRATTPPAGAFATVSNGLRFSCAIDVNDKSLKCWGSNSDGQAPVARRGRYEAVSAGETHACGLLDDWTLSCWGRNDNNQSRPPAGNYRSLAVGPHHGCAIDFDRSISCWGLGTSGETTVPTLGAPTDNLFEQVAVGAAHSCGLDANGAVHCWGSNSDGQTTVPAQGPYLALVAGGNFTCAMKTDHTVVCWGGDDAGVPGDPSQAPAGVVFSAITAGSSYVCGIERVSGTYSCWGEIQNGQGSPP